jgi:hypothetical protein
MQVQKLDVARSVRDFSGEFGAVTRKNAAKLGQRAMQAAHCGHAGSPIASHLQHDYLPVIEGRNMPCT